jgi:cell cycle checkpoint protein
MHEVDTRLWVDTYEPQSEVRHETKDALYMNSNARRKAELAVHVRKVKDVRDWLTEAFERGPGDKLRKYRVRLPTHDKLDAVLIQGHSASLR